MNTTEWWINLLVGAVVSALTGVAASWAVWLYATRILRPEIKFSEKISIATSDGATKYRLKIQNTGRRPAVDFSVACLLRIPGYGTGSNRRLIQLRTLDVPLPFLGANDGRIISIKTDRLPPTTISRLPNEVGKLLNQETPPGPDELLRMFPNSDIRLFISAYDAVSGTRRSYRSKPYVANDFIYGRFNPHGVDILQESSPE